MGGSHFAALEAGFEELLAALGPTITPGQAAEVREFLGVGEYGLALETGVGVLVEERMRPSARALGAIEGLAARMGITGAAVVRGLRDQLVVVEAR